MLLDLVYLAGLVVLSPWLAWRAVATGRYRRGLPEKLFGQLSAANPGRRPVAWFHAVSVGEVHLLATLVPAFRRRHPDWLAVVSSTTDTGLAEARGRFPDLPVVPWPFDFSWAVGAALDAVRPSLVVLTESELWPNLLRAAADRNVPVVVVNARLSPRSLRRLARVAGLARRLLFRHVTRFAVQEDEYADRLRVLGVPAVKLAVTGSIKYDGALKERDTPATRKLADLLASGGVIQPSPPEGEGGSRSEPGEGRGLGSRPLTRPGHCVTRPPSPSRGEGKDPDPRSPGPLVWLAGSTHAPEEEIVLRVFARLRPRFPHLRLVLVPRHPDRFEEVARLVERSGLPFARRSRVTQPLPEMPAVVLLDTVGELGAAWGLADVGYVGGTLDGRRGGQSMVEPAGYGVPAVFGPHVWNFKDAARRLVEVGGAVTVPDADALERGLARLLADADLRSEMGAAARELVRRQQGATARTLDLLGEVIAGRGFTRRAA